MRCLHFLSCQRYSNGKFLSQVDSNFLVACKVIEFLPKAHHYLLMPPKHDFTIDRLRIDPSKVSIINFPYPSGVLQNRYIIDVSALAAILNTRLIDVDVVFLHQPELIYQVMGVLNTRLLKGVPIVVFLHWLDFPGSRLSPPPGFRQYEALRLSDAAFFHQPAALNILGETLGLDLTSDVEKVFHFPLTSSLLHVRSKFAGSNALGDWIRQNRHRYLVFNHRFTGSTNVQFFAKCMKEAPRLFQKYPIIFTDPDTALQIEGSLILDQPLDRPSYAYLLRNCLASICFIKGYCTWNLSVQDSIIMGRPCAALFHPTLEIVLGTQYPYFFQDVAGFSRTLKTIAAGNVQLKHTLSHVKRHDELFKQQVTACIDQIAGSYQARMLRASKALVQWRPRIQRAPPEGISKFQLVRSAPRTGAWLAARKQILWCDSHIIDDTSSPITLYRWMPKGSKSKERKGKCAKYLP